MSSKPSSSKSDPRVAPKDVILTRHKSALMKRQLRANNRSMKHLTNLLKSPTKDTLTNVPKNVQAKLKTPKTKESLLKSDAKVQKLSEKVLSISNMMRKEIALLQSDEEYHPNKVKRKIDVKKVMLKPNHDLQMVGGVTGSVKRKSTMPHKATTNRLKQAESPERELCMADVIRMVEDDLTDEDLMEILTCPSPVWWEDPPDEEYIEDAICKQLHKEPETKTIEVQVRKEVDVPTSSQEVIQPIVMPNLPSKSDNFLSKRSKLETLLGNLKKCDNNDDVIMCSDPRTHNNGDATNKTKNKDNYINDKTVENSGDEKLGVIIKTKSSNQKPGVTHKRKHSDDKPDVIKKNKSSDGKAGVVKKNKSSDKEPGVVKKTKSIDEKPDVDHKRRTSNDKPAVIKKNKSSDEKPGVAEKTKSSDEPGDVKKNKSSDESDVDHKRKNSNDKTAVIKKNKSSDEKPGVAEKTKSSDEEPGVVKKTKSSDQKPDVVHKRKTSNDKPAVIKKNKSSDEKLGVAEKTKSSDEKLGGAEKTKSSDEEHGVIHKRKTSDQKSGFIKKTKSSDEKPVVIHKRKSSKDKLGVINETESDVDKRRSSIDKLCVINATKSSNDLLGVIIETESSYEKPGVDKKRRSSKDKLGVNNETESDVDKRRRSIDKPCVINERKSSDEKPVVINETKNSDDKPGVVNKTKSSNDKPFVINETKSSDDKPVVINKIKNSRNDKPGIINERKSSNDKSGDINKTKSRNDKPGIINETKSSNDKSGIINETKSSNDKSGDINKTKSSDDEPGVINGRKSSNDKTDDINKTKSSDVKPGVINERKSINDKTGVINDRKSSDVKPGVINERKSSDVKPGVINERKNSDDKSNVKNKTSSNDNDVPKDTLQNNDNRGRLSESDSDEILFDDSSINEDELLRGLENMDIPIEHYKNDDEIVEVPIENHKNNDVIVIDDDDDQYTSDIETKSDESTTMDKKQALKRIFKPKKLTNKKFKGSHKNVPISQICICPPNCPDFSSKTTATNQETDTIPETNLRLLDDEENEKIINTGDEKMKNLSKDEACVIVYKIFEEISDAHTHANIDDSTDINKNDVNLKNDGDLELDVCESCKPKVKKVSDDENVKYCLKCSSIFDSTECTYCLEKSKARVFTCTTCSKKFCCENIFNKHKHGAHHSNDAIF